MAAGSVDVIAQLYFGYALQTKYFTEKKIAPLGTDYSRKH